VAQTSADAFRQLFSFEGRILRIDYGVSVIMYLVLGCVLAFITDPEFGNKPIASIFFIPLIWFMVAQGAKRCHDLGNNGFYQFIPFYGLWMLFAEGTRGTNRYGLDSKVRE
jgi:uncharacterized membrane protein YhaH (DUF805 family)